MLAYLPSHEFKTECPTFRILPSKLKHLIPMRVSYELSLLKKERKSFFSPFCLTLISVEFPSVFSQRGVYNQLKSRVV